MRSSRRRRSRSRSYSPEGRDRYKRLRSSDGRQATYQRYEDDTLGESSSRRRRDTRDQERLSQKKQPPKTIFFYNRNAPFYSFTNFSPHPVTYQGQVYPTSEHLFQALKFLEHRPRIAELIRTQPYPRQAFQEAQRFATEKRPDWQSVSIQMMDLVIGQKFRQHRDIRKELLSTGDAFLVEDAGANDAFWGNGADGKGRNELGKALMRLREQLREEAERQR